MLKCKFDHTFCICLFFFTFWWHIFVWVVGPNTLIERFFSSWLVLFIFCIIALLSCHFISSKVTAQVLITSIKLSSCHTHSIRLDGLIFHKTITRCSCGFYSPQSASRSTPWSTHRCEMYSQSLIFISKGLYVYNSIYVSILEKRYVNIVLSLSSRMVAVTVTFTLKAINLETVRHRELPDCYDFTITVRHETRLQDSAKHKRNPGRLVW